MPFFMQINEIKKFFSMILEKYNTFMAQPLIMPSWNITIK